MEKSLEIIVIILIGVIVIFVAYFLLSKSNPTADFGENLNKACLDLLKNGCDESSVSVDGKSFDEVCNEYGLNLIECKKYCGCEK